MTISYNNVSWTGTSLGALFSAYELWRKDSLTAYTQVANITSEATVAFKDYEARRNLASQYKIRVKRTDGAVSAFSAETSGVTPLLATGRLVFTSNELTTTQFVEAVDQAPRQYTFPERAQEHEMYGRDGAVVFKASENELDRMTIPVLLYAQGGTDGFTAAPTTPGRQAFEPLRALSRASASYICICDSDGNRWFSSISAGTAQRREPGQIYTVQAAVREVTRTPSTPATSP